MFFKITRHPFQKKTAHFTTSGYTVEGKALVLEPRYIQASGGDAFTG